uniref:Choline transporterlike protein putative n=1 Tax=Albugo laibachii Nc14 TaxID=890382 RepID=F0WBJ1_9STRA|nr:choline transporterlike protein putative [Albugo laibachii Nc14]|eukprot:CCA18518.1 choline transporterlike protein putative [Albugo laibachii Nc14]
MTACFPCSKETSDTDIENGNDTNPLRVRKRKCTDTFFLFLFLLFWIGMIIIAAIGYKKGNPKRLMYGSDWLGRTCGTSQPETSTHIPPYDFTNYKYLMYPRLSKDLAMQSPTSLSLRKLYGVCVRSCPVRNGSTQYVHAYNNYTLHPDPLNNLSSASDEDVRGGSPWKVSLNTTDAWFRCVPLSQVTITQYVRCIDDCSAQELEYHQNHPNTTMTCGRNVTSNPFRLCPSSNCKTFAQSFHLNCTSIEGKREEIRDDAMEEDTILELLFEKWNRVAHWIGDIQKAAVPILLCGGLIAFLLGFVWLVLLRYFASFFVWLVVVLVIVMLLALTFLTAYQGDLLGSQQLNAAIEKYGMSSEAVSDAWSTASGYMDKTGYQASKDTIGYWAISCYVMIAIDILMLCLLIFMCGRIRIAIGIIREASKAVRRFPVIVLYPIVPTVFTIGLFAYWVVAAAYISTSASITVSDFASTAGEILHRDENATNATLGVINEIKDDQILNYLVLYHLFGLLWTNELISAFATTTIAGAFCEYYWTSNKAEVRSKSVGRSMWRVFRYHFGTMAFGSLIIAIVQMVRIALEYLDRKTKSVQDANAIVRVAIRCVKCFLWCFEKCLKFLNRTAYIVVAMKGSNLTSALRESFSLLFANAARIATVGIISKFLLFLGKLFIASVSTFCMFLLIRRPPSHMPAFFLGDLSDVSSPIFPMLLTGLLSFAVGSFFLDVYGTGVDTILMCFCKDCEVNKDTRAYSMSDELLAFIDGPVKKSSFQVFKVGAKSGGKPTDSIASNNIDEYPVVELSPPIRREL